MQANIVIGLGFGDEGKGITTDYLCSQASDTPIVIRFSGGQQAGHTVMLGEKKHVHSNYCSGTLRGIKSYFTEHCSIYLNTMLEERKVLQEKGVTPKLYVHPLAKLTTPYDVAYNRVMERKLGHGSCGLGIAATMKRHNETGYKVYAMDFEVAPILTAKLGKIREYYFSLLTNADDRLEFVSEYEKQFGDFVRGLGTWDLFEVKDYKWLRGYKYIIFEGSQGIMLDMDYGIFPNVTYANTTSKNALEVMQKVFSSYKRGQLTVNYVTRSYQTRHGVGWMSNQSPVELVNNQEEINVYNPWQTQFRIAELDPVLLNYAMGIDNNYLDHRVARNLVVTCMDQRPGVSFPLNKLTTRVGRTFDKVLWSHSPYSKDIVVS